MKTWTITISEHLVQTISKVADKCGLVPIKAERINGDRKIVFAKKEGVL